MTSERETHAPATAEPELTTKVPENGDAVTPDLPPLNPPAPDLWTAREAEDGEDVPRADPDHPAEAENPEPQEPTD
ncbi:hypothetical protein [Streptomyces sp. WAC05950]|uniref:hypothetical protein n=1 Tax=Streptomyces sp. WAC05950 TaxID=2487419 RepID=UPI0011E4D1B4|nr:hypothetical protein [Streptomyces sp. WAC05950]